jgi:hypothetical protein
MRDSKMMRFRSRHYPKNASAFFVRQEYTFRYYAVTLFIAMIAILLRLSYGKEVLIFGSIAIVLAFLLGSVMGKVALRRNIAEIFFLQDGFSVICIDDILDKKPQRTFPIRFASPSRRGDLIQLNFEDQVIVLKQVDWGGDFDLIWNWLVQDLRDYPHTRPSDESQAENQTDMEGSQEGEAPWGAM